MLNSLMFFGLTGWMIVNTPVFGESNTYQRAGKAKFEETSRDFGKMARGEAVAHTFAFVNEGAGPLTINGVHAACGCTVAEFDRSKVYEPGDRGEITVTLDTTRFKGKLSKSVTVMTDARLLPTQSLTLKVELMEEITAEPPVAEFGDVAGGTRPMRIVKVTPVGDSGVQAVGLEYNEDFITAELSKAEDSSHWEVRIGLKPGARSGFLKETVRVKTSSKSLAVLPILVRANILGSFTFSPAYVEFGAVGPNQTVKKTIDIQNELGFKIAGAKKQVNVNGLSVDDPDDVIVVKPEAKGGKLGIELINNSKRSGSVHGRVVFETTDPAQKEISLDFYAFFTEKKD